MAITSLHYYFPWAMKALVRWSVFCTVDRTEPQRRTSTRRRGSRSPTATTCPTTRSSPRTARWPTHYFDIERYRDFCASRLAHIDEVALEYFETADFDRVLVETVTATFPPHEHDQFVAHYRGLLGAWATDERRRLG